MADNAKWYVIHTYSGYENAVKTSIEKFVNGRGMEDMILRMEIPVETVKEVNESGEAKWMIEAALELGVPTPATAAALYARQTSRGGADDILRVVSTMRAQFGGHVTKIDEIATH